MSVQVLDSTIFEYVLNGLVKTAHNKTCDEFYAWKISSHFENRGDIFKEAERLVISWAYLNEFSYVVGYNDDEKDIASWKDINLTAIWKVEAMQLLKYLEAVSYHIEIETIESKESYRRGPVENVPNLPENAKADYELLNNWIVELMTAILHETEGYKKAQYSNPPTAQPLTFNNN